MLNSEKLNDWNAIRYVSVERHRSTGDKGRSRISYSASVLYEFSVKDTTFNGDRVAYGDSGSSDRSPAQRVVNSYPKGKTVTVYYMPGNPQECLLEPGMNGNAFLVPGLGLVFLIAGILMAIFPLGSTRKSRAN